MLSDIQTILIDRQRIQERVGQLGRQISSDLAQLQPAEVVMVPILTGSIIFVADLMRHLPQKIRISVVSVSSYPGTATSSQGVKLNGSLPSDLEGKHVLIVDDILDSGSTIRSLRESVQNRHPLSVRSCVLLRKQIPSAMGTTCEYIGFDIPDEFVVGYGLDYDSYYRNLPDIVTLKKEAM